MKTDLTWFEDARFGIFIHWGIYGVDGNEASWPVFMGKISQADYMKQAGKFTAAKYDPEAWAALFSASGAKYAVMTTKHHDGVALWDTRANDLSVVKTTPAGRDLVGPYVAALRKEGLKVGLYFSWLDWSNKDYGSLGKMLGSDAVKTVPTSMDSWQNFKQFNDTQLQELAGFSPDLMWFDGDWGIEEKYWGMKDMRRKLQSWMPGVVLNARMGEYGDYDTPEQGIPFARLDGPWELCMTMSAGWGYNAKVENSWSNTQIGSNQLIRILAECAGMGGNLLLNVSPRPDGTIPEWQVSRLEDIGVWLKENGQSIYGTEAGIHKNHYGAPSTLSKDGKTLYLFFFSKPGNQLMIKGMRNTPRSMTLLGGDGTQLKMDKVGGAGWRNIPPTRFITFPEDTEMGFGRVVKIELSEAIDLYAGSSDANFAAFWK